MQYPHSTKHGFTIVELLVVIAVLAVLAGMGSAALLSASDKAKTAAELAAAKTLATAYQTAAADNGGCYLPARDNSAANVFNGEGKPISNRQVRARYPFRLAPYFNYAIESTLLVGDNRKQILKLMNLPGPSGPMYDYGVSAFPSFGISRYFVGGTEGQPNNECAANVAQAGRSVIVFVSAGSSEIDGYEYVRSPGEPGGGWNAGDWTEDSDPGDYGFVHPRHGGKAIAAFLDGSTRLLTIDELRDMRLWSLNAARQDNPAYRVGQ